jgi:hypothetical protein
MKLSPRNNYNTAAKKLTIVKRGEREKGKRKKRDDLTDPVSRSRPCLAVL